MPNLTSVMYTALAVFSTCCIHRQLVTSYEHYHICPGLSKQLLVLDHYFNAIRIRDLNANRVQTYYQFDERIYVRRNFAPYPYSSDDTQFTLLRYWTDWSSNYMSTFYHSKVMIISLIYPKCKVQKHSNWDKIRYRKRIDKY